VIGEPRTEGGEPFSQPVSLVPGEPATVVIPGHVGEVGVYEGETRVAEHDGGASPCLPVEVSSRSTCDTFEVAVANPARTPAEARVFAGEFEQRVTVAGGDTVVVPAPDGVRRLSVDVVGFEEDTVTWQRPRDCATSTEEPGLPDTGVRLSNLIVLAAALIGVGAVLLVVLRRRRLA
jgi:LPXTG-motif cell wall-anchored protein